jgi:hypothetical protein
MTPYWSTGMTAEEFLRVMNYAEKLLIEFKFNAPNTVHNWRFHGYFQSFLCVLGNRHGYLPIVEYLLMDEIADYGNIKAFSRPKWDVVWFKHSELFSYVSVAFEYQRNVLFPEKIVNLLQSNSILINKPRLLVLWGEVSSLAKQELKEIQVMCKKQSIGRSIALVWNEVHDTCDSNIQFKQLRRVQWSFFNNMVCENQGLIDFT